MSFMLEARALSKSHSYVILINRDKTEYSVERNQ